MLCSVSLSLPGLMPVRGIHSIAGERFASLTLRKGKDGDWLA